MEPDTRTGGRRWWALAVLCVLGALRWRLVDLWPQAASTATSAGVGCASAGLAALTYGSAKRISGLRFSSVVCAACAGALMLCGSALALFLGRHTVDEASLTIALALVPVVVAIVRPVFRETHAPELAGRLWPGIAAVAGLLLVLPQPGLGDWISDLTLVAAPVFTAVGAAWLRSLRGAGVWRVSAALIAAGLVFLAAAAASGGVHDLSLRGVLLAAALDGLAGWLSVLALLRLGATRWSAQFVVVPLLIVAESLFLVWPGRDGRLWTGVVLIGLASLFLLLPPRADAGDELSIHPDKLDDTA